MPDIRIPTQKRSIEKRNRIVEKGFELMCEKGYHNTNTAEIAAFANVSTGIIYQYFNDKKEIFIEGIKIYSGKIMNPMIDILEKEKIDFNNFYELLNSMIDKSIKNHTISKKAHEELMAMSHIDEDVSNLFKQSEIIVTERVVNLLNNNNIKIENSKEKIHIIIGIVDNLCHEVVYHKHDNIDYDVMKKEVINIIMNTLKWIEKNNKKSFNKERIRELKNIEKFYFLST